VGKKKNEPNFYPTRGCGAGEKGCFLSDNVSLFVFNHLYINVEEKNEENEEDE